MITAIDFGCYGIRSARRAADQNDQCAQIALIDERAEYVVISPQDDCIKTLAELEVPVAECENALVVFGNNSEKTRWLSRKPAAPFFADSRVPTDDPPARQILNILTESLLSVETDGDHVCCFTAPGGNMIKENIEFLSRVIRMTGAIPLHCSSAAALMLAGGSETLYCPGDRAYSGRF